MTFNNFAGLSGTGEIDEPAQALDDNFQNVNSLCQCTASGTANAITLAANANQPPIPSPPNAMQQFGFVALSNSTGLVTVTIGVNTRNLYLGNGTTQAGNGDILATKFYAIVYNPALNGGAGGFSMAGGAGAAPLNSPAFTGTPTAPTPTAGDSSTKLATTAFVQGALPGTAYGSLGSYATINGSTVNPFWNVRPGAGGTGTVSTILPGTWRSMGLSGSQSACCVSIPIDVAVRVA